MNKLVATLVALVLIVFIIILIVAPRDTVPKGYVSITFDDGLESQYAAAAVLDEYGWKGTFYVPAGLVGGTFENKSVMSAEQIMDLHKRGHEMGGHTWSHVNTSIVNVDEYKAEVEKGKIVESIETENFAYTNGDARYKEIVVENYNSGRTIIEGINDVPVVYKYELRAVPLVHADEYYKVVTKYLEQVKKEGGWLIILVHGIYDEPREDVDLTIEEFAYVLEEIEKSGIEVKTVAEVLEDEAEA